MPDLGAGDGPHVKYHRNGTVWARGQIKGGAMTGPWEWFREDGTKLRAGSFDDAGKQIGEWVTYDKTGNPFKTTVFK
ncbi:MAG TPA: hypothetical protein VHQ86_06370 [Candidatus Saccharimonadia bacterium]|jgi:antitoxin component YwqK of YwqJK toxin-antitoxin module|nr:hypothetical protein [Candidatus Saccharimonadia bacterium]